MPDTTTVTGRQEPPAQVGVGTHIEIELIDAAGAVEPLAFDIVTDQAADADQQRLGANAPLVKAIRGKFVGSVVPYPMGDIRQVRIVRIGAAKTIAPVDAVAQREAAVKKAVEAAERTNAEMFAASYSGKWGDYQLGEEPSSTDS